MNVILLDAAQDELNNANDYYLQHASPRIAETFLTQFSATMALLVQHPALGKPISKRLRISASPLSLLRHLSHDV